MEDEKERPVLVLYDKPFELGPYEKRIVASSIPLLVVILIAILVKARLTIASSLGLTYAFLVLFFLYPVITFLVAKVINKGRPVLAWDPDPKVTSHLRRWFRAEYVILFGVIISVSLYLGRWWAAFGLILYLIPFMYFTWAIESRLAITDKGVATRVGVLAWANISDVRLYRKDGILVLKVSSFLRHMVLYFLYHHPRPKELEKVLKDFTRS